MSRHEDYYRRLRAQQAEDRRKTIVFKPTKPYSERSMRVMAPIGCIAWAVGLIALLGYLLMKLLHI